MSDCFLGIDLGTSSVKILVVDETGRVRGTGSAEHSMDLLRRLPADRGAWVAKGIHR